MGASASMTLAGISLTERECKTAAKQLFDKGMFDALADGTGVVSLEQLRDLYNEKTDVFLTHDWGKELNVDNHERVGRVNEALKRRGLRTWFDAEKMEGNVKKKMISGIENACCIVAFVTQRYMQKVNGNNAEDNCQLEFNYSSRRKTARKMVPVVMEARMRDTSSWVGEVGMVLGGSLYVDLSTDDSFEARMDELYGRIVGVTGVTVEEVVTSSAWKEIIERKLSAGDRDPAPATVAPAAPVVATPHLDDLQLAMQSWIETNTKIVRKFVPKYVAILEDAGVGSVDKLAKKIVRNAHFLHDLGIDEDDADELVMAVMSRDKPRATAHPNAAPKPEDVDCHECYELYASSRLLSKPGKERLLELAGSSTDVPRSMVAKGLLSICLFGGTGSYQEDEEAAAAYSQACLAYLQTNCFQPYEFAVAPSDIEQRPYSMGAVGAWIVGFLLSEGIGCEQDTETAFRYVEVSHLHDFVLAHNTLGFMCTVGQGTSVDLKRAQQLFRLAVDKKLVVALYNMALCYAGGEGVKEDLKEAVRMFREASEAGYAEATACLGALYCGGTVTGTPDLKEGGRLLKRALAAGSVDAPRYIKEYEIR